MMDLLQKYFYFVSSIPSYPLLFSKTKESLLKHGWFEDERKTEQFVLMNKRFFIQDEIYRVIIRFIKENDQFILDSPYPLMICKCEAIQISGKSQVSYRDISSFHYRNHNNILSYLNQSISNELFVLLYEDLKNHLFYLNQTYNLSLST
jgi:hypothetical protein